MQEQNLSALTWPICEHIMILILALLLSSFFFTVAPILNHHDTQ